MPIAYVGLGSNLERPRRQLVRATRALARVPATRIVGVSPYYLTAPIGVTTAQPDFVNAVAVLDTALAPRALLRHLQSIERRQRRRRDPGAARNQPRTLDLDLLLYGRRRLATAFLTLPHPRMHERSFVLRPLLDVAPVASIPGRGRARAALARTRAQRIAPTRAQRFG